MDPVIDEQASLEGIEETRPEVPPADQPWKEPVQVAPEEEEGRVWGGGEVTGIAGGGTPEAASQAEDPGTDTDITLPPVKERINLDRV